MGQIHASCILLLLTACLALGCEREGEKILQPSPALEKETSPRPQNGPFEKNGRAAGYAIDMELGEQVYRQACAGCHEKGISGAPKTGDAEKWAPRIAKGMESLISNSIKGFQGNQGVMPPKGGKPGLTDREVASAVAYIVHQSQRE